MTLSAGIAIHSADNGGIHVPAPCSLSVAKDPAMLGCS